jgi:hypothetical protein
MTLITAPEAVVGRFRPARQLIGAVGPRGAGAPPKSLCDALTVWTDVEDHSLMAVAAVKYGSIDPSVSNLDLWIKQTLFLRSRSFAVVFP